MAEFEVSCQVLKTRLDAGESIRLIDCREAWEHAHVKLAGAMLIPMNETPARVGEYRDNGAPTVVYCHHGVRSLQVVRWLRVKGIENVKSLSGGIDQWSLLIDASLPRY